MTFDIAIIGGGIVGMATAMALIERYRTSLVVLEAEDRLASHQTGHNSGVIHSGLYYRPGSLKAQLCTEGREMMYRFCQEHNIPHQRCGKLVVATDESELPALAELERRGQANGLSGLRRLSGDELLDVEPHVRGLAGLLVPQTGIVDFPAVVGAMADRVVRGGGTIRPGARLNRLNRAQGRGGELVLTTSAGEIRCRGLINCAGLHSDRVARLCGLDPGVKIIPFRGEYYQLRPERHHLVRNLIYPVPDPRFPFLGVHFTRMIGGGVEAGPNAVVALARHGYDRLSFNLRDALETASFPGFWRMAGRYHKMAAAEVYRSFSKPAFVRALQRLMPAITSHDLSPGGAGVRAQALDVNGKLLDDFHILAAPGMVHVLNAPSPAATASIRIGQHIANLAEKPLGLSRRADDREKVRTQ